MARRSRPRHSLHYYLAFAGLIGACLTLLLTIWAYYDEGLLLTKVAFVAVFLTTVVLFVAWFWGGYLVMSGIMPRRRLLYLIFHTLLGFMVPLVYAVYVAAQVDLLTSQPVGDLEVGLSFWGLVILLIQWVSGWSVLPRNPWRVIAQRVARRS